MENNGKSLIPDIEYLENETNITAPNTQITSEKNEDKEKDQIERIKNLEKLVKELIEYKNISEEKLDILNTKVEYLSSSLLNIQLRDYLKEEINVIYNILIKKDNFEKEISFNNQVDEIISYLNNKYKPDEFKEPIKFSLYEGLLNFLNNIKEGKNLGDDNAHPYNLSKIIIPQSILNKMKNQNNTFTKNELILLAYNEQPYMNNKLLNFLISIEELSFNRNISTFDKVMNNFLN